MGPSGCAGRSLRVPDSSELLQEALKVGWMSPARDGVAAGVPPALPPRGAVALVHKSAATDVSIRDKVRAMHEEDAFAPATVTRGVAV